MSYRLAESLRYLPPHSIRHGTVDADGVRDLRYTSAPLAHWLPADAFVDCAQNAVARGTFTLNLHSADDTNWQLATGSCA